MPTNRKVNRVRRLAVILVSILLVRGAAGADRELIVHEWGTFTCLQDENGNGIGGLNTDDEPVPDFVHNIAPGLLLPAREISLAASKSVPRCHPDVTMRLETPIIYFYPGKEFAGRFNVTVSCLSGWLTQYFPDAKSFALGIKGDRIGRLQSGMGRLEWDGISLGDSNEGPATSSHVWITPRRVDSATVEVKGEHEKFLFYRGVANLPAPLRVVRIGPELTITKITRDNGAQTLRDIRELWLLDVRSDKSAAFRVVRPFEQAPAFVAKTPATFAPEDYSTNATAELKKTLHEALLNAGLFSDEADALLETWQLSYFNSPGLRLFFLVPEKWTNDTLPLRLRRPAREKTMDASITRVMVGRIEIVTPDQRALLAKLSDEFATADLDHAVQTSEVAKGAVATLGEAYQQLGRFRNALVLDELKRRPTPGLDGFIKRFGLQGYTPAPFVR